MKDRKTNASTINCYLDIITTHSFRFLLSCFQADLMKLVNEQTLARVHKLEKEKEALSLAQSELGVAAKELNAKLEAANSSYKEAVATLAASEARAAELEGVLASCRRELEASGNAVSEATAAKAALEDRIAKKDVRVGELEAALLANQKEVAALIVFIFPSVRAVCPVLHWSAKRIPFEGRI